MTLFDRIDIDNVKSMAQTKLRLYFTLVNNLFDTQINLYREYMEALLEEATKEELSAFINAVDETAAHLTKAWNSAQAALEIGDEVARRAAEDPTVQEKFKDVVRQHERTTGFVEESIEELAEADFHSDLFTKTRAALDGSPGGDGRADVDEEDVGLEDAAVEDPDLPF